MILKSRLKVTQAKDVRIWILILNILFSASIQLGRFRESQLKLLLAV